MGQFIGVLMWNDMPNQKVVVESFLILHQNMFQVQVLDFELIYTEFNNFSPEQAICE
jgi:hypothetical protein